MAKLWPALSSTTGSCRRLVATSQPSETEPDNAAPQASGLVACNVQEASDPTVRAAREHSVPAANNVPADRQASDRQGRAVNVRELKVVSDLADRGEGHLARGDAPEVARRLHNRC